MIDHPLTVHVRVSGLCSDAVAGRSPAAYDTELMHELLLSWL